MVDRDEYLFNNDPHIGNLWTEHYNNLKREQNSEHYDQIKSDQVAFNKCLVREYTNTDRPGYSVTLDYGGRGNLETYFLNYKFFTSEFNRWHDNFVTDLRLDKTNSFRGWRCKKYSSENGQWQLAVTHDNLGKWVHGYISHKNRLACERAVTSQARSGQLGTSKGAYREVGFNKFQEIQK